MFQKFKRNLCSSKTVTVLCFVMCLFVSSVKVLFLQQKQQNKARQNKIQKDRQDKTDKIKNLASAISYQLVNNI